MMEKQGVCDGEGEAPKPDEKKAADCKDPAKCCGQSPCGGDPMSKLAEEAAKPEK